MVAWSQCFWVLPFLPILPHAGEKRTPAGQLQGRLSWQMLSSSSGRVARRWGLLVVYKSCWTPCMDGESSEAMCQQLAHWKYLLKEQQTQSILFFFISWIAGQWRSRKFMDFLFWDAGHACGKLVIEIWLWNTQELGSAILSSLISSLQEFRLLKAAQKCVCKMLSACLSLFSIFLSNSLPNYFLFVKKSKCCLMICSFWTQEGKVVNP